MPADLRAAFKLASRQHNLITTAQLHELGFSSSAIAHAHRTGTLDNCFQHVHRFAGGAPTQFEPVMAALLHAGSEALASHSTAAAIHGHPAYRIEPVHVLVPRALRSARPTGYVRHTSRLITDDHIMVIDGVRLTTPARTMRDLAGGLSFDRLASGVDRFWSDRLLDGPQFTGVHLDLQKRGRAGTVKSRAVAEARGPDYIPPESNLEGRTMKLLASWYGLDTWRRQVPSGDDERLIGRADFRHCRRPAILEVDSDRHHRSLTDQARDEEKTRAYRAAGYAVERVTEYLVWHRPDELRRRVDDLIARARAST